MPVDTPSLEYEAALPRWQRCRDCFEGSDAIKARATDYLPALEGHQGSSEKYDAYLTRAVFYNATARTVAGLLGSVFRATPSWTRIHPGIRLSVDPTTDRGQSYMALSKPRTTEPGSRDDHADTDRHLTPGATHLPGAAPVTAEIA